METDWVDHGCETTLQQPQPSSEQFEAAMHKLKSLVYKQRIRLSCA
jgi:hypothetical protein